MSKHKLFTSIVGDQKYLHIQLDHNVNRVEYNMYGDDNTTQKGVHSKKEGSCCISFPVKEDVQYFIRLISTIQKNQLSLTYNRQQRKSKYERIEFTKFYRIEDSAAEEDEDVEDQEEETVYTNIQKPGFDFSPFLENMGMGMSMGIGGNMSEEDEDNTKNIEFEYDYEDNSDLPNLSGFMNMLSKDDEVDQDNKTEMSSDTDKLVSLFRNMNGYDFSQEGGEESAEEAGEESGEDQDEEEESCGEELEFIVDQTEESDKS